MAEKDTKTKRKRAKKIKKKFLVIQFEDPPSLNVDEYVCVPKKWTILYKKTDNKVIVSYPSDEAPSVTRERVINRQPIKTEDNWGVYVAEVKYQSNRFNEADSWIASKNRAKAEMFLKEMQPKLESDLQGRRLIKRPLPSSSITECNKKKRVDEWLKQAEDKNFASIVGDNVFVMPPKKEQTVIILDNQVVAQANETAVSCDKKETSSSLATILTSQNIEGNQSVIQHTGSPSVNLLTRKVMPENVAVQTKETVVSSEDKNISERNAQSQYPKQYELASSSNLATILPCQNIGRNESERRTIQQTGSPSVNLLTRKVMPENVAVQRKETVVSSENKNLSERNTQSQYPKQYELQSSSNLATILTCKNVGRNQSERRTIQHTVPPSVNSLTRKVVPENEDINVTTNNVNNTRVDEENNMDASDKKKIELIQQLLNASSAMFAEMGSVYFKTMDMLNNVRDGILKCSDTYHILLQQFNALTNIVNTTRSSSDKIPNLQKVFNENRTAAAEKHKECTRRDSEHRSNYANVAENGRNNYCSIALPPEANDPNNTKWTLKYQQFTPGLVELEASSGVYVSYVELKYSKQVSKNSSTLLRRLLTEVFRESALIVCKLEEVGNLDTVDSPEPILNKRALKVLLNFVIKHGHMYSWKRVSKEDLISVIKFEMQYMRKKELQLLCKQ